MSKWVMTVVKFNGTQREEPAEVRPETVERLRGRLDETWMCITDLPDLVVLEWIKPGALSDYNQFLIYARVD